MREDEEALIESIRSRYERLNELWRKAEAKLKSFHIPDEVEINIGNLGFLGWICTTRGFRICHSTDAENWTPITDSTLYVRCSCTSHLRTLQDAIVSYIPAVIEDLDEAIEQFQKALKK